MRSWVKVVLFALAAGVLGVVASLATTGPGSLLQGPLLRTELGQRALNAAASASAPAPPAGVRVASRGEPIPELKLPDLAGNIVDVRRQYAGKPVLINLWASWCGPCIKEMPELQRFNNEQAPNGTQVVGIALDDVASVRAFLKQVPVDYPILLDSAGPADAGVVLGNPSGVLPYSVLVAADGRLLKQRIGPFGPGEIDDWARL